MNQDNFNNKTQQLEIANNTNTPALELEKLATLTTNREILKAIAKNPNTSPSTLLDLAGKYLEEIGENPALELIFLENPSFIADIFYQHYSDRSYEEERTVTPFPEWFVSKAFKHSDSKIREYIAENTFTPIFYLEKLAKDKNELVRIQVAANRKTLSKTLAKLSLDPHSKVKYTALENLLSRYEFSIIALVIPVVSGGIAVYLTEIIFNSTLILELNFLPFSVVSFLVLLLIGILCGLILLFIFFRVSTFLFKKIY